MKNVKQIMVTTLILTVICAVSAAGLAFTDSLTSKRIVEAEKRAETEAMERVLPAEGYTAATVTVNGVEHTYYVAVSSEETVGYVFSVQKNGYGGKVKVMTGIGSDGKITAVEVLNASDETPGLGQNVTKNSFSEQFVGIKDSATIGANIEAVTGATISSKAAVGCVNEALELYTCITEGGQNEQ